VRVYRLLGVISWDNVAVQCLKCILLEVTVHSVKTDYLISPRFYRIRRIKPSSFTFCWWFRNKHPHRLQLESTFSWLPPQRQLISQQLPSFTSPSQATLSHSMIQQSLYCYFFLFRRSIVFFNTKSQIRKIIELFKYFEFLILILSDAIMILNSTCLWNCFLVYFHFSSEFQFVY